MANDVEFEVKPGSFIDLAVKAGHKILIHTIIPAPGSGWAKPGKDYFWMKDPVGNVYLERIEDSQ